MSITGSIDKIFNWKKSKISNVKNSIKYKSNIKMNKLTLRKNLTNKTKYLTNCKLKPYHYLNNKIMVWNKWANLTKKDSTLIKELMT